MPRVLACLFAVTVVLGAVAEQRPFFGHPIVIPGRVPMHWFDQGGEGVAYHDCDPPEGERTARDEDGVDFDHANGVLHLGWLCPGEWIEYTLHVADHADYRVRVPVGATKSGGQFRLEFKHLDGTPITMVEFNVPATGGWTSWHDIFGKVTLPTGPMRMRFVHMSDHATYNVGPMTLYRFDPLDLDRDGDVTPADQKKLAKVRGAKPNNSPAEQIEPLELAPADHADLVATLKLWNPIDGSKMAANAPWKLVWSDEFDKAGAPDRSKWRYEVGYKIRNDELQHYTDGANSTVKDGHLIIEARKETSQTKDGRTAAYTAASMSPTTSWTYGRIEVRAKLPTGRGMWPAIWTLGDNIHDVGWPLCGEIDIMENVGFDPLRVHGSIHTETYNHNKGTHKSADVGDLHVWDDFHVYAIEWREGRIDFFIDRVHYLTVLDEGTGREAWPFDQPQHLKLNIAIGGMWGGVEGVNDEVFPQQMVVDYVRVYQGRERGR